MENSSNKTKNFAEVKILLMRHAESEYNKIQSDYKKANGYAADYPSFEKLRFEDNPRVVDADLTELGIQQSKDSQTDLNQHKIRWVITSPLRRAHKTAQIGLESHPNLKNIEFSVNPYFREKLITSGDLGVYTHELFETYPNTDFSSVENNPIWYLDYWGVEGGNEHTQKLKEIWIETQDSSSLINYMRSISPIRVESPQEIGARVDRAYLEILNFVKAKYQDGNFSDRESEGYDQLLVVAHRGFIDEFLDRHGGDDPRWKAEKGTLFRNAEVKEFVVKFEI